MRVAFLPPYLPPLGAACLLDPSGTAHLKLSHKFKETKQTAQTVIAAPGHPLENPKAFRQAGLSVASPCILPPLASVPVA